MKIKETPKYFWKISLGAMNKSKQGNIAIPIEQMKEHFEILYKGHSIIRAIPGSEYDEMIDKGGRNSKSNQKIKTEQSPWY